MPPLLKEVVDDAAILLKAVAADAVSFEAAAYSVVVAEEKYQTWQSYWLEWDE